MKSQVASVYVKEYKKLAEQLIGITLLGICLCVCVHPFFSRTTYWDNFAWHLSVCVCPSILQQNNLLGSLCLASVCVCVSIHSSAEQLIGITLLGICLCVCVHPFFCQVATQF